MGVLTSKPEQTLSNVDPSPWLLHTRDSTGRQQRGKWRLQQIWGGGGESHKQLNMTKSLGEQKENYLTVKLSNAALKIT